MSATGVTTVTVMRHVTMNLEHLVVDVSKALLAMVYRVKVNIPQELSLGIFSNPC